MKIGTETHGTIRNVTLSDCIIDRCSRAVGIWVRDGGTVEDIHIHHLTGSTLRYADRYAEPGAPGWWGKGEPIFISATPRKNSRTKTGTIRDLHMTFKRQGTQPGGLFDEQPSVRHVYSHAIPALYARSVKQLTVQDSTVRYADKSEAWASEVTTLEDCTESAVDLKKIQ